MTKTACPVVLLMWATCALGQTIEPQARIVARTCVTAQVSVVEVAAHFVTAIRVPETVNSVVVGDPALLQIEHSEHEPQLVFVKVLTAKPAQTNVLISTAKGHQLSLLVVSRGEQARPTVDFVVNYRPEANFVIEPALPSVAISETVALKTSQVEEATSAGASPPVLPTPVALGLSPTSLGSKTLTVPRRGSLKELLEQQQRAPLPELYGEHPKGESGGGDRVRTGVSEVIDGGQDVIVLFSVVNPQARNILLMPPQVQLGGKTKQGKLIKQSRWT